ncbi:anoctamin 1 isoform X2 [Tachypleus tridentatus]|uniref:anoctamin 1 isoform X2 n=1 Tax=Tachypleus tridentatus TaxID=6853 RepID=UPI003FD2EE10
MNDKKHRNILDVDKLEKRFSAISTESDISIYHSAEDLWLKSNTNEQDAKTCFTDIKKSSKQLFGGRSGEGLNGVSSSREVLHSTDLPEKYYVEPSLFFEDGLRRIDFVLLYTSPSGIQKSTLHKHMREVFEENLKDEGLELEYDTESVTDVNCVKVHAPWEVLTRYADIMRLKMPMKKVPDFQKSKYSVQRFMQNINVFSQSVSDFFNTEISEDHQFTAEYSRDKEYLFDIPEKKEDFFNPGLRAQVVDFILKRKRFSKDPAQAFAFGINNLINEGVYEAAYPLHEGGYDSAHEHSPRRQLLKNWATIWSVWKYQPLDQIKEYFGVKIGLYFAWLGFYTYMLIPASIVGVLCFLYGCFTLLGDRPSDDVCKVYKDTLMCPHCDVETYNYWKLGEACVYAKMTHFLDNGSTVFFAVFMSLWGVTFLELWKRYSAKIAHHWDMTSFDVTEEHPRPEYLAQLPIVKKKLNVITRTYEPHISFWKKRVPFAIFSCSVVILLVTVALVAVVGVILYRLSIKAVLSISGNKNLTSMASVIISTTAAVLNLVCLVIFDKVYQRIANYLTELEMHRTQTEYENSLTLKMFVLQFVNYYSSIFYIAFFKGRFGGYPGNYSLVFGYCQEECGTGGCLLELSMQLAIIMVGKQAINAVFEIGVPWLLWFSKMWHLHKKEKHKSGKCIIAQWESDYSLLEWGSNGLFFEYLEMVLQFGFVTIFVVAFPLAPLFALLNNLFEIRLDARKFITSFRRPVPMRVKSIGIWYRILDSIGKLSVITNGVIIAFTSSFIDQLFYVIIVSPDGSLDGYLNFTLSEFSANDFSPNVNISNNDNMTSLICSYQSYREPPTSSNKYELRSLYWHLIAARLGFVVVFETTIVIITTFIRWLIPDVPKSLKLRIRHENYITNEMIIEQELRRAKDLGVIGSRGTS